MQTAAARLLAEDFEAVVTLYRPRIFRFALASLRDRDAAETIAQDCLLKAFVTRQQFREECSIQTWLMQIAVNLVRDYTRNRRLRFWRRTQQNGNADLMESWVVDERDPEALTSAKQQIETIWRSASALPEKQKRVFLLRFVEEMDLLEIAKVTGMKEGTVKAHLFRSLRTIRRKLAI